MVAQTPLDQRGQGRGGHNGVNTTGTLRLERIGYHQRTLSGSRREQATQVQFLARPPGSGRIGHDPGHTGHLNASTATAR